MEPTLVNADPRYRPPTFVDPPPWGYVLLSAEVAPPAGRAPVPRTTVEKSALLANLKARAEQLTGMDTVHRATVYRAVLVPPPDKRTRHPARYDVAALIETASPDVTGDVQASPAYRAMVGSLHEVATDVHVMAARCLRCVADVDKRPGLFLFNYFDAEDERVALPLWEHMAGWYTTELGVDNSTLLGPTDGADYTFVNHARLDRGLPRFALGQFLRRSFWTYVRRNLNANKMRSMPILYRLA